MELNIDHIIDNIKNKDYLNELILRYTNIHKIKS